MPVHNGKRFVAASSIFSWAHAPIVIDGDVGLLAPHRVQALVGALDVQTGLLHCTRVVSILTFIDIFATAAVVKKKVSGRAGAVKRSGSVHAHVLAEELREAALIHIIASNSIVSKFIARITAAQERAISVDAVLYTWIFSGTFIHILAGPPICVQSKAWIAGTGIGAWHVGAQLLTVSIAAFVNVEALAFEEPVPFSTGAGVPAFCVDANLGGVALMGFRHTFININTLVAFIHCVPKTADWRPGGRREVGCRYRCWRRWIDVGALIWTCIRVAVHSTSSGNAQVSSVLIYTHHISSAGFSDGAAFINI